MNLTYELAGRMLDALPGTFDEAMVPRLAAGLTEGLAVIPDVRPSSRRLLIVLDSPLEARRPDDPDFLPTFLVGERDADQLEYLCRSGYVAHWFQCRDRQNYTMKRPGFKRRRWIRAATHSKATLPIDGDLPDDPPTTPNPTGPGDYEWFAAKEFPVGAIIYHIDANWRLTLFQRLTDKRKLWGRVALGARTDAVDVVGIVDQMRREYGDDFTLPSVDLTLPLMARIPRDLHPDLLSVTTERRRRERRRHEAAHGLRLADLTEERLADLIALYDDCTGASAAGSWPSFGPQIAGVYEQLHRTGCWEWRFGYPGNPHAKLIIRETDATGILQAHIDTNDDGPDGYPSDSSQLMGRYRRRFYKYLVANELAVPIPTSAR
jgi:hypothetical protein